MRPIFKRDVINKALKIVKENIILNTDHGNEEHNWVQKTSTFSKLDILSDSLTMEVDSTDEVKSMKIALTELESKFSISQLLENHTSHINFDEFGTSSPIDSSSKLSVQNMVFILLVEVFQLDIIKLLNETAEFSETIDIIANNLIFIDSVSKLKIINATYNRKEEINSYRLHRSIEAWSEASTEEAIFLLKELTKHTTKHHTSFIPRIIVGIGQVQPHETLIKLFEKNSFILSSVIDRYILSGLSQLKLNPESSIDMAILKKIESNLNNREPEYEEFLIEISFNIHRLSDHATRTLYDISNNTDNWKSEHLLISYLEGLDMNRKEEIELTKCILTGLRSISPERAFSVKTLSRLFTKLLVVDANFVIKMLLKFLSNPTWRGEQGKCFSGFLRKASKDYPGALNKFLFEALKSDQIHLQFQILQIFTENNLDKEYSAQFPLSNLKSCSEEDLVKLIRRSIGFVYENTVLRSLLASILYHDKISVPIQNLLKDIFLRYLCFNYPTTLEWFNQPKIQKHPKSKKFFKEITDAYEQYFGAISELPLLKEFEPDEDRMNLYYKTLNKRLNESRNEASKSSFTSLFQTIYLKGSHKWCYRINGEVGSVSALSKIEVSTEYPRGEYIDPLSMEKIRLQNRF